MTVQELRNVLKNQLAATEPIDLEDLKRVNPFSRREIMQQKSRELIAEVHARSKRPDVAMQRLIDVYDHLATDWVHGEEIEWEGSLADRQAQKIRAALV